MDRGPHQLEVVLLLFALKAMYPTRVFLVRGNHEFRSMNEAMGDVGFLHQCKQRLPTSHASAYEAVHTAFEWLPLGALVERRVLVVHGGIGDGSWGLKELKAVSRPLKEPADAVTVQVLWSDPSDSDSSMRSGVHQSLRGENIPEFGPDVTHAFCAANDLLLIVRSHQYVRQGYKVMHGGRLVTLFSARNYFYGEASHSGRLVSNDGALLLLAPDGNGHLRIHPKRLAHVGASGAAAGGDWRMWLLGSMARCLQVDAGGR